MGFRGRPPRAARLAAPPAESTREAAEACWLVSQVVKQAYSECPSYDVVRGGRAEGPSRPGHDARRAA